MSAHLDLGIILEDFRSLNKYLLSSYFVAGRVILAEVTAKEQDRKYHCTLVGYFLLRATIIISIF